MRFGQRTLSLLTVLSVATAGGLAYGVFGATPVAVAQIAPDPNATPSAPVNPPAPANPNATPATPSADADTTPPPDATPEQIAAVLAVKPGDIGLGDPKAPVTWIEYASSGCPHCADQDLVTLPKVKAAYIETGKVYYVLRDFPLDGVSAGASLLARCAPPDKFYAFMDKLFSSQRDWHSPDTKSPKDALFKIAGEMGMSGEQAEACLKDQGKFDTLTAGVKEADEVLKINATPTNFINGDKVEGALPFDDLEAKIKAKLPSK